MRIGIKVKGFDKVNTNFEEVKKVLSNIDPELNKVGKWILGFLRDDVFETEGQIISAPWKPLKASTLIQKVRQGYEGRGTLERTGKMRKSWRMRLFGNKMIFENPTEYAVYHQEGGKNLPKRPLVKVNNYFASQIERKLTSAITAKVKRAFNNG